MNAGFMKSGRTAGYGLEAKKKVPLELWKQNEGYKPSPYDAPNAQGPMMVSDNEPAQSPYNKPGAKGPLLVSENPQRRRQMRKRMASY